MAVPLLDLKAQYAQIKPDVDAAIAEVVASQYFILGPTVQAFEEVIAEYCGVPHAVGVSSGTDALILAMMAEGIGPGDEVITTAYSFFATAGSIVRLGAKPVFVDIDPVSYNIDPQRVADAVTPRTRAIVPVHLYGQVADMTAINEIAQTHNLIVIEDAAQAIGATADGVKAGALGHHGCFSFFPTKNLGGFGDAGMVTTRDDARAGLLRKLRVHGGKTKYEHELVGGNFRIDAIQAAVLKVKLPHLDGWTDARRANAEVYRRLFRDAGVVVEMQSCCGGAASPGACDLRGKNPGVILPVEQPGRRHIYNQFVIRVDRREALREHLRSRQIGHEVYYPIPFHQQECFAGMGHKVGDFPASECAAETTLALPIYSELTDEQQAEVVDAIVEFVKS
jgi:dTDP-4-amino-4,6-dideoxygalactose transaminase